VVIIGTVQRGLEVRQDPVPLGSGGVEGNQVIVVERHAVGAELGELVHGFDRVHIGAGGHTERVIARPSHGPQAKSETVFRSRLYCHFKAPHRARR
jgi:hypothetical protein